MKASRGHFENVSLIKHVGGRREIIEAYARTSICYMLKDRIKTFVRATLQSFKHLIRTVVKKKYDVLPRT